MGSARVPRAVFGRPAQNTLGESVRARSVFALTTRGYAETDAEAFSTRSDAECRAQLAKSPRGERAKQMGAPFVGNAPLYALLGTKRRSRTGKVPYSLLRFLNGFRKVLP